MTVRKLNEQGDIVTTGDVFIQEREEIAQTCVTRLKLFLGEYFRDITDGTPWFQQILGKFESLNTIESILRNRIARTPGVVRLLSFNLDYDLQSRSITISSYVLTQFGETEVLYNGAVDPTGL